MKQYTTFEQTAKLIELGFEKPKSISSIKVTGDIITTAEDLIGEPTSVMGGKITANYSIGELIEMLPPVFTNKYGWDEYLHIYFDGIWYVVAYNVEDNQKHHYWTDGDLIDALYDMLVKLKEEGVI